jgi:protein O-mannosyl-transferase
MSRVGFQNDGRDGSNELIADSIEGRPEREHVADLVDTDHSLVVSKFRDFVGGKFPRQVARYDRWLIAALLILTVVPYVQTGWFDFVSLDDRQYVTNSPLVKQGLAPFAIWDAFFEFHADNWHPLVWLSLMLDFQLFGLNAGAFHLENVAWHLANVAIAYVVLRKLTDDFWRSAWVAAIFGIHPLHVESVAWITERKDVLSGFFWMTGMWAYSRWTRSTQSRTGWLAVTVCLVLGLMTKQILVALPCVFLLLDFWPLKRTFDPRTGHVTAMRIGWLIWEKLPWFGLSLGACFVAINAQQSAQEVQSEWPLSLRVSNAAISVFRYISKVFFPVGLTVQYPFDPPSSLTLVLCCMIGLVVFTLLFWLRRRTNPAILMGWLWFLTTLAPVIGLIQIGKQSMADRYMYLPLIGLAIVIGWSIPKPASRAGVIRLTSLAVVCLAALMFRSVQQVAVWKNSDSLYRHALAVDPTNENAHFAIGWQAFEAGDFIEGLNHVETGVEWERRRWEARQSYAGSGQKGTQIEYRRRWSEIYLMLGNAEIRQHRRPKAIQHFREAVSLNPDNHEARMLLGMALADEGENLQAIEQFDEILKQLPDHHDARMARSALMRTSSPLPLNGLNPRP